MKDFLFFRKMISPWLIQLLFWLAILFFIFTAIVDIYRGANILFILEILILGPIAARVFCELFILFFRINDNLASIKQSMTNNNP